MEKTLGELNKNHVGTCPCFNCVKKLHITGLIPGSTLYVANDKGKRYFCGTVSSSQFKIAISNQNYDEIMIRVRKVGWVPIEHRNVFRHNNKIKISIKYEKDIV